MIVNLMAVQSKKSTSNTVIKNGGLPRSMLAKDLIKTLASELSTNSHESRSLPRTISADSKSSSKAFAPKIERQGFNGQKERSTPFTEKLQQ